MELLRDPRLLERIVGTSPCGVVGEETNKKSAIWAWCRGFSMRRWR